MKRDPKTGKTISGLTPERKKAIQGWVDDGYVKPQILGMITASYRVYEKTANSWLKDVLDTATVDV